MKLDIQISRVVYGTPSNIGVQIQQLLYSNGGDPSVQSTIQLVCRIDLSYSSKLGEHQYFNFKNSPGKTSKGEQKLSTYAKQINR